MRLKRAPLLFLPVVIAIVAALVLTLALIEEVPPTQQPDVARSGEAKSQPASTSHLPDDPEVWVPVLRQERKIVIQESGQSSPVAEVEVQSLGDLTPGEMMFLMEGFQSVAVSAQESKLSLLASSPATQHAVTLADLEISIAGAEAKAGAVMDGSYLLLPATDSLPAAIVRHPHLHIVCCSGGTRDGIPFKTWLLLDLRKYGRLALALDDYARLRRAEIRELVQEFNACPEAARRMMVHEEPGLTEAMRRLWQRIREKGIRIDGIVAYEN